MRKHAAANDDVRTYPATTPRSSKLATKVWQDALAVGAKNGWRNAQASVLAPTGTIGLMMDCDTTGIEPDLALVKFKKLVGGGSMQIVNQTVPRALKSLGYQDEQVEAIVEFIAEHGHVIDAPGLRREHYEVFDCAMGERSIAPMGHVRMMAAVQPFISRRDLQDGEHAGVGHRRGRRARSTSRAGSSASRRWRSTATTARSASRCRAGKNAEVDGAKPETARPSSRPVRKRLPKKRPSQTVSFTVGGAEGYLHAGSYPDDGLGEIFVKLGKQGSTLAGVMDAFSMSISVGLQYGIPLEFYVSKFTNLRFEPAGMTDDPDVRIATTVLDYLFRRLALDYLPYEKRAQLGIFTAEERAAQVATTTARQPTVDLEGLRTSVDATPEHPTGEPVGRPAPAPGRGRQLDRAAGAAARQGRRRAAVHDLRHEDAPGRVLLRLRGLRLDLRLQLRQTLASGRRDRATRASRRRARHRRGASTQNARAARLRRVRGSGDGADRGVRWRGRVHT